MLLSQYEKQPQQIHREGWSIPNSAQESHAHSSIFNNRGAEFLRSSLKCETLDRFEEVHRLAPDSERSLIGAILVCDPESHQTKGWQVLEELLARHPDDTAAHSALDKMGTE